MSHGPWGLAGAPLDCAAVGRAMVNAAPIIMDAIAKVSAKLIRFFMPALFALPKRFRQSGVLAICGMRRA